MKKFILLGTLSWIACMTVSGDTVLEYEVHSKRTILHLDKKLESTSRQTLTIGSRQARFDSDTFRFILDVDLGKFWVLLPGRKEYWEFESPLRLETEVPEEQHGNLAKGRRAMAASVHWAEKQEPAMFGEKPVFVSRGTVMQPLAGIQRQVEVMVDPKDGPDLLNLLRRSVSMLDFLKASWFQEIIDLGEIPVLYKETSKSSTEETNLTLTLVSRDEREVDGGSYQVPEGYTREEFSLDMLISF